MLKDEITKSYGQSNEDILGVDDHEEEDSEGSNFEGEKSAVISTFPCLLPGI